MDILNSLQFESLHLDVVIIILVICSGQFAKRILEDFCIGKWVPSMAMKTLIVSLVFCAIYIGLLSFSHELKRDKVIDYFISFCVATSLYDLVVKPVLKKYFPNSNPDA